MPGSLYDLLAQGRFDKKVDVMVGINLNEVTNPKSFIYQTSADHFVQGVPFAQNISTAVSFDFTTYVKEYIPQISSSDLSTIVNILYPAPGHSTPYNDEQGRVTYFTGDLAVYCHETGLSSAYKNKNYVYEFSTGRAWHVDDVPYTFYDGPSTRVVNDTVAETMQRIFTDFTITGAVSGESVPHFPRYGEEHKVLNLTTSGFPVVKDPHAGPRCQFMQHLI